jgi:hypothetical protein
MEIFSPLAFPEWKYEKMQQQAACNLQTCSLFLSHPRSKRIAINLGARRISTLRLGS